MEMDTKDCCICLSLMVEPIKIKCLHYVCLTCTEKLLMNGNTKCPMDRKAFDYEKDLVHDLGVFQQNFKLNPEDFMDRANKTFTSRNESEKLTAMMITFGNYHELRPSNSSNVDLWKCFVKLEKSTGKVLKTIQKLRAQSPIWELFGASKKGNSKDSSSLDIRQSDVIKFVKFNLHPTFNPPYVIIHEEPFEIRRLGWGVFTITIVIHFQDYLQMEPMEIDHMLSFSRPLTRRGKEFFVDLSKIPSTE